jgi:membrane-associated PAP2 superfamily phosphatase
MFSAVLLIGGVSIVELMLGVGLLALLFSPMRKTNWSVHAKRSLLIILGVILISPALTPAGSTALIPLPLGVLLAFIRRAEDVTFLFHTLWFLVPSMLVTGFVFGYMARRLFPDR